MKKKLLGNKEMVFKNGVKTIQAAAYKGRHTVDLVDIYLKVQSSRLSWLVAHPSSFRMFMKG